MSIQKTVRKPKPGGQVSRVWEGGKGVKQVWALEVITRCDWAELQIEQSEAGSLWGSPRSPAGGPGCSGRRGRCGPCSLAVCPLLLRYSPKSPPLQSETVHYKRGVSQHFSLPSFKIDFSEWKDDEVILAQSPTPSPGSAHAGQPGPWACSDASPPWRALGMAAGALFSVEHALGPRD